MGNTTDAFMSNLPGRVVSAPAPQDFEDFVDAGLVLVHKRDDNAWALGDLAVAFVDAFPVHPGRPVDPEQPTLSDLAAGWDVEKPRVSEWHSVAAFFAPNVRRTNISWTHHNMARRASAGDINNAIELLDAVERLHLTVAAFRRYLGGIYYEGAVDYNRLPEELQAVVPAGKKLWIVIKEDVE